MSTATGRAAEEAAANYLVKLGHRVIARNWRTRWCEIDLITQRSATIYFVEVKYRRGNAQGDGLDYITPTKLKQMHFAAEYWLSGNDNNAQDFRLAAISLTGEPPKVVAWLSDLS